SDPKKIWTYIRDKRKVRGLPASMHHDGTDLNTANDIINAFASYFGSVYVEDTSNNSCDTSASACDNISDNTPVCDKLNPVNLCDKCANSLWPVSVVHSFSVSSSDILAVTKKMKANFVTGPDRVPAFVVSDTVRVLLEPLCFLFNLILKTHCYPDLWKSS